MKGADLMKGLAVSCLLTPRCANGVNTLNEITAVPPKLPSPESIISFIPRKIFMVDIVRSLFKNCAITALGIEDTFIDPLKLITFV